MSIDPRAYYATDIFSEEIDRLFRQRAYVGTESEFPAIDAYKVVQLGNEPITIRRTTDGIRAFSNVCLHRNALIDPPGCGVRPFRCPYHAWAYGSDGSLTHAPKANLGSLERTRLRHWDVSIQNGLVFVGNKGLQTDDVAAAFSELNMGYATPFYGTHLDHDCNWKLVVENVLESYHLSTVHPQTFVPAGMTSNSKYQWTSGDHVSCATLYPAHASSSSARLQKLIPGTRMQYGHAYVFPNVFVANSNDHIGYVAHFIPTGPEQTRLEWCLFEQPLLLAQSESVRRAICDAAIKFTTQTLAEDKVILESCQVGIKSAEAGYSLLGDDSLEARLMDFQSTYARRMSNV